MGRKRRKKHSRNRIRNLKSLLRRCVPCSTEIVNKLKKRIKCIKITWDLHFWGLKTKSRILKEWSRTFFSIQSTKKNGLSLYCTLKKWFYNSHEFMAPPTLLSWLALYSLKNTLRKGYIYKNKQHFNQHWVLSNWKLFQHFWDQGPDLATFLFGHATKLDRFSLFVLNSFKVTRTHLLTNECRQILPQP